MLQYITAVGLKKNVAQFCKGRRSEYTRVISSVTTSHVMKPTLLETLMNCNILPIKKHINFYSFGREFKMRRVRNYAIGNTTLIEYRNF